MSRQHNGNPGLFALWREDRKTHREGLLAQGFWAVAVYRFSHCRLKRRYKIVRLPWAVLNVLLLKFVEFTCGISIPESVKIGRRLNIEHFGGIIIHGNAEIGDDCLIRHGVTLGNSRSDRLNDAPRLGNEVEIGAGAKVLGAISIGDGSVIGANAVVTRDIPAGAIAVGAPARVIKFRSVDVTPSSVPPR